MIALILIGALAVFFIVSLVPEDVKKGQKGNQPASTVAAEIPASPITASDLASAYEANEVRADSNYKDKMLAVTGTVDLIQSTLFGSLYVSLKDESKQYSFMSITCYFPDEAKNQLANLSKGQKVTVTGKCGGKTMSIVSLRDCRLN